MSKVYVKTEGLLSGGDERTMILAPKEPVYGCLRCRQPNPERPLAQLRAPNVRFRRRRCGGRKRTRITTSEKHHAGRQLTLNPSLPLLLPPMRSPIQDFGIGQYTERGIFSFIFSYDIASRLRQADHNIGEPEPCSYLTSEMGRVRRSYRSNCRRTSAGDNTSAGRNRALRGVTTTAFPWCLRISQVL